MHSTILKIRNNETAYDFVAEELYETKRSSFTTIFAWFLIEIVVTTQSYYLHRNRRKSKLHNATTERRANDTLEAAGGDQSHRENARHSVLAAKKRCKRSRRHSRKANLHCILPLKRVRVASFPQHRPHFFPVGIDRARRSRRRLPGGGENLSGNTCPPCGII